MSNYTETNNFTALTNAQAVINGAAFDLEYGNIATAIASKLDSASVGESVGNLNVTSATLPTNGIYRPAGNQVGIAANTTAVALFGPGMQVGVPTGGDKGAGTINVASGLYVNGAVVQPGAPVTTFGTSNPSITLALANTGFVSSASGLTITIPANASVAFPNGTMLTFQNNGGGSMSIGITSDTLQLANTSTTGTRTLAANGIATAYKVASTKWIISGVGLT